MVIGTTLVAIFVKYVFPYNWTWLESLLFGAMLSATDPVAVIALLQEVSSKQRACSHGHRQSWLLVCASLGISGALLP